MEAAASQRAQHRQLFFHQLWIAVAAAAMFFTGLGAARLWDEDETDYSRIAREMTLRGDWVVPSWNYRMWGEKPALYYWLVAGSFEVLGENEFAARLPSALLALATALLTYHLGRVLFRPQVGLWAGFVLMTSLMFDVIARAATHDATLIFFTTSSLLAYAVVLRRRGVVAGISTSGQQEPGVGHGQAKSASGGESAGRRDDYASLLPQSHWEWFSVYAPMALATLVKGPIGAILPACGIGLFLVLSQPGPLALPEQHSAQTRGQRLRRWASAAWRWLAHYVAKIPAAGWAMRPLLLAGIVLVIAGPWYVWVAIRTGGEWPLTFFWRHNIVQFANTIQGHHGPFYYYAIAIFLGFFPWSPLLIAGATTLVRRIRSGAVDGPAGRLALCWAAVWIGLFSLCATKLPHYVAPAYPLLAIITGLWIADWIAAAGFRSAAADFSESAEKKGTVPLPSAIAFFSPGWLSAVWAALALAGVVIAALLIWVAPHWLPGQPNFAWLGAILIVGAAVGWLLHRGGQLAAAAASLACTSGVFLTCVLTVAAAPISRQQSGYVAANAMRAAGLEPTRIGMFRWAPQGFVYYCDWPGYIEYCPYAKDALHFLQTTEYPALLVDAEGLRMIEPLLPPGVEIIDRRPRFLKSGEVILLGRRPAPASTVPATASAPAHVGQAF